MWRDFQEVVLSQFGEEVISQGKRLEKDLRCLRKQRRPMDRQASLERLTGLYPRDLLVAACKYIDVGLSNPQVCQVIPGAFIPQPMTTRNTPHKIVFPAVAISWRTCWSGSDFASTGSGLLAEVSPDGDAFDYLSEDETSTLTCVMPWTLRSQRGEIDLISRVVTDEGEALRMWDMLSSEGVYDAVRVRNLFGYNFGLEYDWLIRELTPENGTVEHVGKDGSRAWGFTDEGRRFYLARPGQDLGLSAGDKITVVNYGGTVWGYVDV